MQKLGRYLAWSLGGLAAAIAVVFLALNLYVQSRATQTRIQQELSQRLGATLRVRQISITPWGGLTLSGISIPQDDESGRENFLTAQTFRLRVQLSSLFRQPLVIKQISLIQPEVIWPQNAEGKWRLPMHRLPDVEEESAPVGVPAPPEATSSAPPSVAPATPETKPPRTAKEPRTNVPEIRRVSISKGDFRFLDDSERIVARFAGVQFRSQLRSAQALNGTIRVNRTSLRERFFLEGLQSPLVYDPTVLDFSNISARMAGGLVNGQFTMRPQEEGSPFVAVVRFTGIDADKLLTEAGGPAASIRGRLEGRLDASGKTADPEALAGEGEIYLRDGSVQQYSLLVALGQILQIEELTQLNFDQAQIKYRIEPGLVTINELIFRSPNIRLSAVGTINFSGKLRLESQLAVSEKIRAKLFSAVRKNFKPLPDDSGYSAVDFQVRGTIEKPKTNLVDRLVGRELKDLGGVIRSLFESKREEPKAEAAPAAGASATPDAAATANPPVEAASPSP